MIFGMSLAFLIFDPKSPFCKSYSLCCMGYSLCRKADFQNPLISPIFGVFFSVFFYRTILMFLQDGFSFWTQSHHFAKAIAFPWAIVFVRWQIFKILSFLQYLLFLERFLHRTILMFLKNGFWHVLAFLIFDPKSAFYKGYSLCCMGYTPCKMVDFQNPLILPLLLFFRAFFCTEQY